MRVHYQVYFSVILTACLLAGCGTSISPAGLPPVASPTSTTLPATPTPTPPTTTPTLTRISYGASITGLRWSEDGAAVHYATRDGAWWAYDLATDTLDTIPAPFDRDSQLWERLQAEPPPESLLWFGGGISPSGRYVVYRRLPPDHNYTPTPNEFYLPPYEIWVAQSDGSNARSLRDCWSIFPVIWLDQERQIIFGCGQAGAADVRWMTVQGQSERSPATAYLNGLSLSGRMALSPDESRLAVTAEPEEVKILHLNSGETEFVSRGYVSGWSPDGQRLYYQKFAEDSWDTLGLHFYDLESGLKKRVLPPSLHADDGT